jgi:2Fe-2S ferredoxin
LPAAASHRSDDAKRTRSRAPLIMPAIRVLPHPLCPEGRDLSVSRGVSLLESLIAAGIAVEHACEGACACATCHVYVREGGQSLARASDEEEDEIDMAWGVDRDSRLACQVRLCADDLVVELPKHTRNLARERG